MKLLAVVAVGLASLLAAPAWAQIEVERTDAEKCLVVPPKALSYPFNANFQNAGGSVIVEMEFTKPKERPVVRVLDASGPSELRLAVTEYVQEYRLPCVRGDERTTLRQEFIFEPSEPQPVRQLTVQDLEKAEFTRLAACVAHQVPSSKPSYPSGHVYTKGVVLLRLKFMSPDGEPEIEVVDGGPDKGMVREAVKWVRGYRMPCNPGKKIEAIQMFMFTMEGAPQSRLIDSDLFNFLRNVKDIRKERVSLDLNQMGCPFLLRFRYMKPNLPNEVLEPGASRPERKPLVDWLETLRLDVRASQENTLLGASMTITVPCGTIDLKGEG